MSGWRGEVYTRSFTGFEVVQRSFSARWLWLAHIKRKWHAIAVDAHIYHPDIGVYWRMWPITAALAATEADHV